MLSIGGLVTVTDGRALDGIVFDVPSPSKVVVAVVVPGRGPALRTVNQKTVTPREAEGPDDRALRLLIRRTPPPAGGSAHGADAGGQGRSGFKRGATHRSTGR